MNCKNCGAVLTGTEAVCPNCGNPVEQVPTQAPVVNPAVVESATTPAVDPMAAAQPVATPMPEATPVTADPMMAQPAVATPVTADPMMAQPAVATPVQDPMMAQPVPTEVPSAQPAPVEQPAGTEKKKDKTTIILIAVLVGVVVIAAVLYFTVFKKESPATTPATNNNTNGTEVSTNQANVESYGGYDFTIPDGFTADIDSEFGLVVNDDKIAYTIGLDYTNTYDDYRADFQKTYPNQMSEAEVTVAGRKYLALRIYDETTKAFKFTMYITNADNAAFIGVSFKRDKTEPTQSDFTTLTTILDSAKKGSANFAAGSDEDMGKDGIKKFNGTLDVFK